MKCIVEGHIRRDKLDGCGKEAYISSHPNCNINLSAVPLVCSLTTEYTLLQVLHSVFRANPGCPSDKRNLRNRLWQAGRDNDTDHNGTSSQLPKDLGRVPAVFACSGKAAAYVGL